MGTSSHPHSAGGRSGGGSGSASGKRRSSTPPKHLGPDGKGSAGRSLGDCLKDLLPGIEICLEPRVVAAIGELCNLVVYCRVHADWESVIAEYGLSELSERPGIVLMNAVASRLNNVPRRTILADLADRAFRQALLGLLTDRPRLLVKATSPEIHEHVRGFTSHEAMRQFCANYLFNVLEHVRAAGDLPFVGLADQLKTLAQDFRHEAEMRRYAERLSSQIVALLVEQSRKQGTPFSEVRALMVGELEQIIRQTEPKIAELMQLQPDQVEESTQ